MGGVVALENRDLDYRSQLAEVLRSRDPEKLREFLQKEAEEREPDRAEEIDDISPEDLEIRMHKMIVARPDLSDLHADSRRWLHEHGKTPAF